MENEIKGKLVAWHRMLLNEAMTISYRIADEGTISDVFFADLAASLENLAARVKRERVKGNP